MSGWADGYVADIHYTSGFYAELSPTFLSFLVTIQGLRAPDPTGSFTYCELGCGQGFGTSVLAAAHPHGRFWGFDFSPAQICNASRFASLSQLANITFAEESFEDLANGSRSDLPKFDYITLHGIYSWVSPENRRHLLRFIRQNLKPGGIVYVSYNCMPGWSSIAPLQKLLREHANLHPNRSDRQMEAAVSFVDSLNIGGSTYFKQTPMFEGHFASMKAKNVQYLAHEYLNATWQPLYHADVAREMQDAKLSYVCSANILENIDVFSVPEPIRKVLEEVTDPILFQTIKDYAVNKQFRKDIYVRGGVPMSRSEHDSTLSAWPMAAVVRRHDCKLDFKIPIGSIEGAADLYNPIFDALTTKPSLTIGELASLPPLKGQPFGATLRAVQLLLSSVQLHPATPQADKSNSIRFNCAVAEENISGTELTSMAAANIGSGAGISYVEACAYPLLVADPSIESDQLADGMWKNMQRTGRKIVVSGQTIEDEATNLRGLRSLAGKIIDNRLPLWRQLGMI